MTNIYLLNTVTTMETNNDKIMFIVSKMTSDQLPFTRRTPDGKAIDITWQGELTDEEKKILEKFKAGEQIITREIHCLDNIQNDTPTTIVIHKKWTKTKEDEGFDEKMWKKIQEEEKKWWANKNK